MADDEHKSEGIPETVTFLVGLLLVLGALWWIRGAPKDAFMQGGIFLNPPAPLGNGEPYGPDIGTTSSQQ